MIIIFNLSDKDTGRAVAWTEDGTERRGELVDWFDTHLIVLSDGVEEYVLPHEARFA